MDDKEYKLCEFHYDESTQMAIYAKNVTFDESYRPLVDIDDMDEILHIITLPDEATNLEQVAALIEIVKKSPEVPCTFEISRDYLKVAKN